MHHNLFLNIYFLFNLIKNEQKSNKDYYEKELKKIETTLVKNLKELNELQNKLSRLETTYPFILNDKDLFGKF